MSAAERYIDGDETVYQPKPGKPGDVFTFNDGSQIMWHTGMWVLLPRVKCSECSGLVHTLECVFNREAKGENLGFKQDSAKHRWSLLPSYPIAQVIAVLEFGAAKYKVDNWQQVGDARRRYYDATMRHLEAWWIGEKCDTESGLHHLAHAACCCMFLIWFDKDAA